MSSPITIAADGLGYTYPAPRVRALEDVTFALPRGAFCAILGPNGSGKTTLIRLVMGLIRPTVGQVRVLGHDPAAEPELIQRLIGYVPQREAVNSSVPLTAREVVSLAACTRRGVIGGHCPVRDRVSAALEMVDMGTAERRPFNALSGGQQQRVLIARALAVDPHILVLDEPFAAVDAATQNAVVELLHRVCREHQVTVLAVVHNINPLVHYVDHVLLLRNRQVAFGDPAQVLTPQHLQEAYGAVVPILICEEGYRHPVMQTSHE